MPEVMNNGAMQHPWANRTDRLFARAFNIGAARNTLRDNEEALAKHELMDARIIDCHREPDSFVDLQDHCQ